MAAKWKKGVKNTFAIDLGFDDIYGLAGDSFNTYIKGANGTLKVDALNEVVVDIDNPVSAKVDGDTSANSTKVKYKNESADFKKGMVVNIGGQLRYIQDVDTNSKTITLRKPLSADVQDGADIKQVGNTGIYEASVTLDEVGFYWIVINNPSINLFNETQKIEVVDYDDSDIMNKIADNTDLLVNKMNEIEDELKSQERIRARILA